MSERDDSDLRRQRKGQQDKDWKKNPKERFFEARKQSITDGQFKREKSRIERFESFISQHDEISDGVTLRDVITDDVYLYLRENLDPDSTLSDKTVEEHLIDLNYFYKTLQAHSVLSNNPVNRPDREVGDKGALTHVRESDNYDTEPNAKRPHIPFERMAKFLSWLNSPKIRAIHLVGLKSSGRSGSVVNLDLRCVHIAHPLYYQLLEEHNIKLDERVRDKPDSFLIYQAFSRGTEIPNENRPGPDEGEVRSAPCKRGEKDGSVIPIDSELKTALLEWVIIRPPTPQNHFHPLFTRKSLGNGRMEYESFNYLWANDIEDSVRRFGNEEALDICPECGGKVVERNPKRIAPGRHYDCRDCGERHWRSIMWDGGLETPQKFVFHCHRNFFSDAHREGKSEITDNVMAETVRKYKIRGDAHEENDADRQHYDNPENLNWEKDVRQPYLEAIYKFNIYNRPVSAVGEGWDQ